MKPISMREAWRETWVTLMEVFRTPQGLTAEEEFDYQLRTMRLIAEAERQAKERTELERSPGTKADIRAEAIEEVAQALDEQARIAGELLDQNDDEGGHVGWRRLYGIRGDTYHEAAKIARSFKENHERR